MGTGLKIIMSALPNAKGDSLWHHFAYSQSITCGSRKYVHWSSVGSGMLMRAIMSPYYQWLLLYLCWTVLEQSFIQPQTFSHATSLCSASSRKHLDKVWQRCHSHSGSSSNPGSYRQMESFRWYSNGGPTSISIGSVFNSPYSFTYRPIPKLVSSEYILYKKVHGHSDSLQMNCELSWYITKSCVIHYSSWKLIEVLTKQYEGSIRPLK